jgi:predicted phosphoribosyltransferase
MLLNKDFTPAERLRLDGLLLEKLAPQHAEADFAAVRESAERIRHVFGPDNGWPDAEMSFEENLADLQRHAAEFEEGRAFNYALLSAEGND